MGSATGMAAVAAQSEWPRIGVGLFLLDAQGRFLLMERKGAHGAGRWGLVGGKMEFGWSMRRTAVEEAREEVGVELDPARVAAGPYTEDVFKAEGLHYVTLFASARLPAGQVPRILEPHKCSRIGWFTLDALPSPLFQPFESFVRQGFRPPFAA